MSSYLTPPSAHSALVDHAPPAMRLPSGQPEISFPDIWRILRKRRTTIGLTIAAVFGLAILFTAMVTPKYKATATIEVNRQNTDLLSLDDMQASMTDLRNGDYGVIQQTEAKVLENDTLLLRVAKDLKLENRKEFSTPSLTDYLRSIPNESGLPLEDAPYRRTRVLKAFHKNLRIDPVAGTRLLTIEFLSPDRQVAANVVNTLIRDHKDENFDLRSTATTEETDWLAKQIRDLKDQVQDAQQKLADYQNQVGILGTDETHNIVMSRLEDLNRQVTAAEANRIVTETILHVVRNGNPELISGLVGPSLSAGAQVNPDSLALLANLREHENELKVEYAQDSQKYGSAYPKLIELQAQIDANNQSIDQEVKDLAARAENDYHAAQETENGLRALLERQEEEADKLNDSSVRYSILKHDADASRDLYDSMVKKLKEAGILAGLRFTNIVALDAARPPDRPATPIVWLNLAAGLIGGIFLGLGVGFVKENADQTISTPDQAEALAGVAVLGTIPRWKTGSNRQSSKNPASSSGDLVPVLSQPRSPAAESYRFLRASLQLLGSERDTRVLMFTSALPGEGKTTTSINCAAALAGNGAKVLLVEADLRKPRFQSLLHLDASPGLSGVLTEPGYSTSFVESSVPRLSVLPAGPVVDPPSEVLGSDKFRECMEKWRMTFDYVILDTPPVLTVADAMSVAPLCDSVILVVRYGQTSEQSFLRAASMLRRVPGAPKGVVVNSFDPASPDFDRYYGYKYESAQGSGYYPRNWK